jgi:class 3 adenylate cyclase
MNLPSLTKEGRLLKSEGPQALDLGAAQGAWGYEQFRAEWLGKREHNQTRATLASSFGVHLVSMIIVPVTAHRLTVPWLVALHGSLFAIVAAAWIHGSPQVLRRTLQLIIGAAVLGYLLLLAWVTRELGTARDTLLASSTFTTFAAFGVLLTPGRLKPLLVGIAVLVAGGVLAMLPAEGGQTWATIFGTTMFFSLVTRWALEARLSQLARREYDFATLVAPAHFVRHALRAEGGLDEAFKPKTQYCVCVASDWRNYQELAATLSASQLTMSLNEYYDLCHTLLSRHLPKGNYYADWIADELFVVIFGAEDDDQTALVEGALGFAQDLVASRAEFARIHGLPRALDVGISAGEALLGLMGPARQRKATALGEIPGRSRRFQAAGKLVRKRLGEADRVLFDRECLLRIRQPFPVKQMDLTEREAIRDVADRELFYLEPTQEVGGGGGGDRPTREIAS